MSKAYFWTTFGKRAEEDLDQRWLHVRGSQGNHRVVCPAPCLVSDSKALCRTLFRARRASDSRLRSCLLAVAASIEACHAPYVLHERDGRASVHAQEADTRRQAHGVCSPCALLPGRQVLKAPSHLQEALRATADAEAPEGALGALRPSPSRDPEICMLNTSYCVHEVACTGVRCSLIRVVYMSAGVRCTVVQEPQSSSNRTARAHAARWRMWATGPNTLRSSRRVE